MVCIRVVAALDERDQSESAGQASLAHLVQHVAEYRQGDSRPCRRGDPRRARNGCAPARAGLAAIGVGQAGVETLHDPPPLRIWRRGSGRDAASEDNGDGERLESASSAETVLPVAEVGEHIDRRCQRMAGMRRHGRVLAGSSQRREGIAGTFVVEGGWQAGLARRAQAADFGGAFAAALPGSTVVAKAAFASVYSCPQQTASPGRAARRCSEACICGRAFEHPPAAQAEQGIPAEQQAIAIHVMAMERDMAAGSSRSRWS